MLLLLSTYDKFLEFAMKHRHLLHYKLEHTLPLLHSSTHSLLQCHRHMSLLHSFQKKAGDLPAFKSNTDVFFIF